MNLGYWEIGLILITILLFFYGRKIPHLAKVLGESIREFMNSLRKSNRTEGE
jgi:Sec-independent protein translocase protein TatA